MICTCDFIADESGVTGSHNIATVSSSLLAAEREEAKAVLTLFLRKQGLSYAMAARTINKSDPFIEHLISKLHRIHKSRYLVGSGFESHNFILLVRSMQRKD